MRYPIINTNCFLKLFPIAFTTRPTYILYVQLCCRAGAAALLQSCRYMAGMNPTLYSPSLDWAYNGTQSQKKKRPKNRMALNL